MAEFRRLDIQNILHDTAGHGGSKMLGRMMGIVSIWDITSIEDLKKRAFCERPAIKIGSRWVLERKNINNVQDFIGIVKAETVDFTIKQGGVA